jgi:hypothetical protein
LLPSPLLATDLLLLPVMLIRDWMLPLPLALQMSLNSCIANS